MSDQGGQSLECCLYSIVRTSSSPRDEIAGCIEKAYEKILFTEATRILFFNTPKKMTDYAKKVAGVQGVMGPRGALTNSYEGGLEGPGARLPRFKNPSVYPQASHQTSLNFSFPICRMRLEFNMWHELSIASGTRWR